MKCHAGCEQTVVIASLKALGLWPEREQYMNKIIATYDYTEIDESAMDEGQAITVHAEESQKTTADLPLWIAP